MKKNGSDSINSSANVNAAPASFAAQIKRYRWAIMWVLFHISALILSYKEVRYFNSTGEPKTDKFWPFVKFTYPYFLPNDNATYVKFNGFFTQYDWTEFSFYVGGLIFIIILMHVYRKSE